MNTINPSKLPLSTRPTEHGKRRDEVAFIQSPLQILIHEANGDGERFSGGEQSTNNNFNDFVDTVNFRPPTLTPGLPRQTILNKQFTTSAFDATPLNTVVSGQQTEPNSYTVKSGNTLNKIAALHGLSLNALLAANPQIINPDQIFPGDIVKLPSLPPIPEQPEAPKATLAPVITATVSAALTNSSAASVEFDYNQITGVDGNENITPEFIAEIEAMAKRLGTQPEFLIAVMSFESAGTFSPSIQNPLSGATGLIQFIASTARSLGTNLIALSKMSPVEQLTYVEKYFVQPHFTGKLGTIEGLYSAVLSGQAKPNPDDTLLHFVDGHQNYSQNAPLDINNDGRITSGEAATGVLSHLYGDVSAVQQ